MKWNQLTGKAAQDKPWVNYIMPINESVYKHRGENRVSRRAKDKAVRLEIKHLKALLPTLEYGTDEHKKADLRKSELEMYQSGSHESVNKPYVKKD
jgi:hypothetical protein